MSSFFGTPFSDEGLTKLIVKLTLKVLQTGCLEEDLEDHVVKHFVTKFILPTATVQCPYHWQALIQEIYFQNFGPKLEIDQKC